MASTFIQLPLSGGTNASTTGLSFLQTFANDTDFTYNATKTQFIAGTVVQIDKRPNDAITWATYQNNIDLNFGGGVLTGTPTGGAAISGNRLDLAHSDIRYVNYNPIGNADSLQTGTFRYKYTPNYSGAPTNSMTLFTICKAVSNAKNIILLRHIPSGGGDIQLLIKDLTGGNLINTALGRWTPVSGTTYEFELNFDISTGATRLFINGIQFGATQTATGVRDSNIGYFAIGTNYDGISPSNFFVEDFISFSTVQHTSNYTPGYTLSEYRYIQDPIELPRFIYAGTGNIYEYLNITTQDTGIPKYTWNGLWHNGSIWTASTNIYSEANNKSELIANLASFPITNTLDVVLILPDSNGASSSILDNLLIDFSISVTNDLAKKDVYTLNSSTLTLDTSHEFVSVDYTATGATIINLPSADSAWSAANSSGRIYTISDTGVNAASNNITINRAGSDTITSTTTGNTNEVIATNGKTINIIAINSSTWKVF